jgi:hypothetical protein
MVLRSESSALVSGRNLSGPTLGSKHTVWAALDGRCYWVQVGKLLGPNDIGFD